MYKDITLPLSRVLARPEQQDQAICCFSDCPFVFNANTNESFFIILFVSSANFCRTLTYFVQTIYCIRLSRNNFA